jgi:hypothetical protein
MYTPERERAQLTLVSNLDSQKCFKLLDQKLILHYTGSETYIIVLLRDVFHIGLGIDPRPAVLA